MGQQRSANPQGQGRPAAGNKPQTRDVGGIRLHHSLEEDFSVYGPASFVERAFATLIDSFIVGIVISLMNLPFIKILGRFAAMEQADKVSYVKFFISAVAFVIFQILPLYFWGQSLGKSFMGLKLLTRDNATRLGFWRICAREIVGKAISTAILFLGLLMMLGRADKLTLHDLLLKTKVIKHRR